MDRWGSDGVLETPLEGGLRERAQDFLAQEDAMAVKPHYAATVMLIRHPQDLCKEAARTENANSLEVFMLRRASTMEFVPDAVVFPGGKVDARDGESGLSWAGPSPSDWALRMGCEEHIARCVVVAAAREVFEECGVLLAGVDELSVIDDLADPLWARARELLASHKISFSEFLREHGLVLRTDLLQIRSHWLTPEFEPRRFDTFFFAARLPEGQASDGQTSEAAKAGWIRPGKALEQAKRGEILLLPPTRYNLSQLAHASDPHVFMSERLPIWRIMFEPCFRSDGTAVLRCVLP